MALPLAKWVYEGRIRLDCILNPALQKRREKDSTRHDVESYYQDGPNKIFVSEIMLLLNPMMDKQDFRRLFGGRRAGGAYKKRTAVRLHQM